jgi:hypothetical protein
VTQPHEEGRLLRRGFPQARADWLRSGSSIRRLLALRRRAYVGFVPADVHLDIDVMLFEDQREAVVSAFRRAGIEPVSTELIVYAGADVGPWVIVVTLATPVAAFFQSFGAEAGKDAYATVKAWFREIRDTTGRPGYVDLRAPNGSHVVLPSDIPDEAVDALHEAWAARGSYPVWDPAARAWVEGSYPAGVPQLRP